LKEEEEKKFPESTVTGEETWVDHFTPQTKKAGMHTANFSDSQKTQSVSVSWKIYGLCILGCRRSHPC